MRHHSKQDPGDSQDHRERAPAERSEDSPKCKDPSSNDLQELEEQSLEIARIRSRGFSLYRLFACTSKAIH